MRKRTISRAFFVSIMNVIVLSLLTEAKLTDHNETHENVLENKVHKIAGAGMALVFVEELKLLMERHVLGICPQNYYKLQQGGKKNSTGTACEVEIDPHDLAGRLASLALRAHSAARSSECSRLAISLANAFSELARTAAHRQILANTAASEANKKRKLSKSQKAKLQAKQRTALAVKKKAAAIAARLSA